jgi:hypothetical protein
MLSHRTAGEEWRMLAPDTSMPVHITLPYGMSAVSQRADTVLDMAVAEPTAQQVGGSPA